MASGSHRLGMNSVGRWKLSGWMHRNFGLDNSISEPLSYAEQEQCDSDLRWGDITTCNIGRSRRWSSSLEAGRTGGYILRPSWKHGHMYGSLFAVFSLFEADLGILRKRCLGMLLFLSRSSIKLWRVKAMGIFKRIGYAAPASKKQSSLESFEREENGTMANGVVGAAEGLTKGEVTNGAKDFQLYHLAMLAGSLLSASSFILLMKRST